MFREDLWPPQSNQFSWTFVPNVKKKMGRWYVRTEGRTTWKHAASSHGYRRRGGVKMVMIIFPNWIISHCENELHRTSFVGPFHGHIPPHRATCVRLNVTACRYELSAEVKPNAYEGLLKWEGFNSIHSPHGCQLPGHAHCLCSRLQSGDFLLLLFISFFIFLML